VAVWFSSVLGVWPFVRLPWRFSTPSSAGWSQAAPINQLLLAKAYEMLKEKTLQTKKKLKRKSFFIERFFELIAKR